MSRERLQNASPSQLQSKHKLFPKCSLARHERLVLCTHAHTHGCLKALDDTLIAICSLLSPSVCIYSYVVAQAATGSGKTLAYLLPCLHRLLTSPPQSGSPGPRALVLVPTRELCQQVNHVVFFVSCS